MKELKKRIAQCIEPKHQRGTPRVFLSVAIFVSWFFLSFIGLFYSTNLAFSLLLCVSLGFANAAVGFNIFHDAVHGSFSYRRWVNHALAFGACSIAGPSHFIWRHKHNYLHHQYTNVQDWDDDLDTRGALRLSPNQEWLSKHRYQHFFAPLVYALTTIEWVFVRDFIRYFGSQMNPQQKLPKMKKSDHVEFWVSKTIYVLLTVVLPLLFFPLHQFVIGFLIVHLISSLVLAVVFQLAHVMEDSEFPVQCPKSGKIGLDWVALQFATTVNFAPTCKIMQWYSGGLNFQIEHHLLPGVCHVHYKKLSPIVEAMAHELGFPYHSRSTHWQAIQDHFRMLKKFSMDPSANLLETPLEVPVGALASESLTLI